MADVRNPPETSPVNDSEWVTLNRAAEETGVSRYRLMKAGNRRELAIEERSGIAFVTRASLDAFLARREPAATAA